jgi:hypothetical protein
MLIIQVITVGEVAIAATTVRKATIAITATGTRATGAITRTPTHTHTHTGTRTTKGRMTTNTMPHSTKGAIDEQLESRISMWVGMMVMVIGVMGLPVLRVWIWVMEQGCQWEIHHPEDTFLRESNRICLSASGRVLCFHPAHTLGYCLFH